jgi:hypothetical protein
MATIAHSGYRAVSCPPNTHPVSRQRLLTHTGSGTEVCPYQHHGLTAVVLGQPDWQPVHVGLPDGVAEEAERPDPSTWSGMCTAAGPSWMIFVGDLVDRGPDTPGRAGQVMGMVGAGGGLCGTGRYEANWFGPCPDRTSISHGLSEGRSPTCLSNGRSRRAGTRPDAVGDHERARERRRNYGPTTDHDGRTQRTSMVNDGHQR